MTEDQRDKLRQKIKEWRSVAKVHGSVHPLWDQIFDAEALLVGRATLLPEDKVLAMIEDQQ